MSKLVYFAVGGTGLRSVEPLLHLCALGLGPDQLRLVLIDPDQTHPAGTSAVELMQMYQRVRLQMPRNATTRYFATEITSVDEGIWSPIGRSTGTHDAAQRFAALVGAEPMQRRSRVLGKLFDMLYHPEDEQTMPLEKGFRGRPSIGTVFMNRIATAPWMRDLLADREASFFSVGSVFGGTGAAALPVIGRVLRDGIKGKDGASDIPGAPRGLVGAALALPFFRPLGGAARADDGGIMPDPATFALNTLGAMPYYTQGRSGYGEMFMLGESVWRETEAAPGGEDQDNGRHHVEFLAAAAAIHFARQADRNRASERFWVAAASDVNVRMSDVPLPSQDRDQIAAGMIAIHTLLNYFGDRAGVDPYIQAKLF
jgi:hypothetical protein